MLSPLSILQNTRALQNHDQSNHGKWSEHHDPGPASLRERKNKGETASAAMPFFSWHAKVQQIPARLVAVQRPPSIYLKGTEEATHNLRRNQIRLLSAGWLEGDDRSLNFQQFCFGSLLC